MYKSLLSFLKGKSPVGLKLWRNTSIAQIGAVARAMVTTQGRFIASFSIYLRSYELKATFSFNLPKRKKP